MPLEGTASDQYREADLSLHGLTRVTRSVDSRDRPSLYRGFSQGPPSLQLYYDRNQKVDNVVGFRSPGREIEKGWSMAFQAVGPAAVPAAHRDSTLLRARLRISN